MRIIVRAAGAGEAPLLVELMHEFYAESDYALDRTWAAATFSALLEDRERGGVWLALEMKDANGSEKETPVGYVVLTVRFSMEFGGLDGFVDDLFVRPEHRRRGVGSALLAALADECQQRGLKAVHVETSTNSPAATLYAKLGWQDRQRLLLTRPLNST